MNSHREASSLEECLERIARGESAAECLARMGDDAAAIEPLVATADRLQRVRAERLSEAQRQQARATLAAAMRQQGRRAGVAGHTRAGFGWPWSWQPRFGPALAAVVAVLLLATMAFTAVAGQPGQAAYKLRVAVERLPVLLSPSAEGRVAAELRLADRRLVDAEAHLLEAGKAAVPALDALLASDAMAAGRADALGETERAEVHARIATHARLLAGLSETAADGQAVEAFERAAMVANQIALQLAAGAKGAAGQHGPQEPRSNDPVTAPTQSPARRATATGGATTAPHQPTATPEAAATVPAPWTNASATPAMRRSGPGAAATDMPGRSPTVLPATPAATTTPAPQGAQQGPGGATPTPGQRATDHFETATPPGPQGTPSGEGPGAQGTPPGEGPGPQGPSDGGAHGQPPGTPPGTPEATAMPAPPAGTPDGNAAPPGHAGGSLPADGPAATPGHP